MKKRAIISVYDKTGLIIFGQQLLQLGWEIVASGGTARALTEAGVTVTEVSSVTNAPEMLGGRVKTLHPAIHAGILARDTPNDMAELESQNIGRVDLVVCNLYPFAETIAKPGVSLEAAVEQIDIGGVTLLRAAAKNFQRVMVLCDPADYDVALAALPSDAGTSELRRQFAAKAFALTRDYDLAIEAFLGETAEQAVLPEQLTLALTRTQTLRYGENPHQTAALYAPSPSTGPLGGRLLQGKELSYNNLLDLDAAHRAAVSFTAPTVVIVKHLSPCGIASAERAADALAPAIASDPVSAFGGVIAINATVDSEFTAALAKADLFVEAVVAPEFTEEAAAWFYTHKKNCRLVEVGESASHTDQQLEWRSIRGGVLVQQRDQGDPASATWRTVSARSLTAAEESALRFAWVAAQHVKSNAIVLATESETIGIGGGLPSRVDAVRLALEKAGPRVVGSVMASDAFFPFADSIALAAAAGVAAVIQPGGSIRDDEVIAAVDKMGLAMVFTGVRHFRH